MDSKQFKKLIQEAVREAVREELVELFTPKKGSLKENFSFTTADVVPQSNFSKMMGNNAPIVQPQIEEEVKNPYMNFIMDTAKNMSPQDLAGLRNLD